MSGLYSPRLCESGPISEELQATEESIETILPANDWTDFSFNNFSREGDAVEDPVTPFDEPHELPTSTRSAPFQPTRSSYQQYTTTVEAIYAPPEAPQKRGSPPGIVTSKSVELPSKNRFGMAVYVPSPPHNVVSEPCDVSHKSAAMEESPTHKPQGRERFLEEGIQFSWDQTEPSQSQGSHGDKDQDEYEKGEPFYANHYFLCSPIVRRRWCLALLALFWIAIILFLGLLIGAAIRGEQLTMKNILSIDSSNPANALSPLPSAPVPTSTPFDAPTVGKSFPPTDASFTSPPNDPPVITSDAPVTASPTERFSISPASATFESTITDPPIVTATASPIFGPVDFFPSPPTDPPVVVPTASPIFAPIDFPLNAPTDGLTASPKPTLSPTFMGPPPSNLTVGAYYYPWHGDNFHGGKYLREKLEPRQYPSLSEYDDTQGKVIAQHLSWSRQANIKLWVTSWWGPDRLEDKTTKNVILNHPDLGDHKIALHYETSGRIREDESFTTQRVFSDIEYICQTYFDHPNYHRIDGRPVLFMYLTRKLESTGKMEEVILLMRSAAKLHGFDMYIIGDHIWQTAPTGDDLFRPFLYLDAMTNYDVYGSMGRGGYATQFIVDKYYEEQRQWRHQAGLLKCRYIPAVTPGFNDRAVRLSADHVPLSRKLTWDSGPGSLFQASIEKARYLVDEGAGNLLLVNSFNEWHEDTQIEPTVGESTNLPYEYTKGLEYGGYGELYLDILRDSTIDRTEILADSTQAVVDPETVVAKETDRIGR